MKPFSAGPRTILKALAALCIAALLLSGCSAAEGDSFPASGSAVDVPVMWVGTNADGAEIGGIEVTQVWTGPSTQAEYSVDLSSIEAEGAGAAWKAASASAATVATLFNGSDPSKLDIRFRINSPIDGPSAGGILTIGLLASLRGLTLDPSITMTGTISPDGSIGPIGGAYSKVTAAADAGYETAIIPAQNRSSRDPLTKKSVDLVEYGKSIGIIVVPVFQLAEAFPLFTGEDLFGETTGASLNYQSYLSEQRSLNISQVLALTLQYLSVRPDEQTQTLYAEAIAALERGDLNLASGIARENYLSTNRSRQELEISSGSSDFASSISVLMDRIATIKDEAEQHIAETTQRAGLTDSQYASMPEMLLGTVTAQATLTALEQAVPQISSTEELTRAIHIYADQEAAINVFFDFDEALLNLVQGPKEIESENPIAFLSNHTNFLVRSGQANMGYLSDVLSATKELDNNDVASFQTTYPVLIELDLEASSVDSHLEGLSAELAEAAYAMALYVNSGALVSESQALGLFNAGIGEEGDTSEEIDTTRASIEAAQEAILKTAIEVDAEGWDTAYPLAQADAGAAFALNQMDASSSTSNVARGLSRLWAASIAVFLMKAAPA